MIARSVIPAGFLRVGRNWRKCTQRSRLTCSSRSSSASGSVWSSTRRSRSDHSSSPWITSAADCLPRLSPPAASPAFIAAISRCAKGRAGVGDKGLRRVVEHGGAGQHVAGDRKAVALDAVRTSRRIRAPVCAAMRPLMSMTCSCRLSRPSSAAISVSITSRGDLALAQQLYAVDAVIGIDQRLRRDAADAGRRYAARARRPRKIWSRPRCRSGR